MTSVVLGALGLENESVTGKVITVEENGYNSSTFILSSIMDKHLRDGHKVILLLFQNSFGHFHNISLKLGYNLQHQLDRGNFSCIEFLNIVRERVYSKAEEEDHSGNTLKNLYFRVKEEVQNINQSEECCLVLENITNLLYLHSFKSVYMFLHYICGLLNEHKVRLIISFNSLPDNQFICNSLKYKADTRLRVDDLKTGFASDISGSVTVQRKGAGMNNWNTQDVYHYQLLDKNIRMFAPGLG